MQASADVRLQQIAQARAAVLADGRDTTSLTWSGWQERAWIERSWRRCLDLGHRPDDRVGFDLVPAQAARRAQDANQPLAAAARPVLNWLGCAIANTRYFAILTDARGIVLDVDGPIDRSDRRAQVITRVGVDLSERAVGTTAIGAALTEQRSVWLHRGEHFFGDTSVYSCAGAPVFGPDGDCVGMLDLTGISTVERPELVHLVAQSAQSIEGALVLQRPHAIALRINWPGRSLGEDGDGLVCVDDDGAVTGANRAARQMLPALGTGPGAPAHCSGLFAMPYEQLFDHAGRLDATMEVPTWSGLRLQARLHRASLSAAVDGSRSARGPQPVPLRDVEAELIRKAVQEARGNVSAAALSLGISRATVYRKLGRRTDRKP